MTVAKYPTIQGFPWKDSIDAVKASEDFQNFDDFYKYLIESLPQNSLLTRQKYAELIVRRFFPEKTLSELTPRVWQVYHDEKILTDLMRLSALEAEPAIAEFVLEELFDRMPGSIITTEMVKNYIIETFGEYKKDSYQRLLKVCRYFGFLSKHDGDHYVMSIPLTENAFIILLHDRLARTPRIVRISEISESKWWRKLGLRDLDYVRSILRKAEAARIISRFVKVDDLGQITSRYSRDEYLERALRL